MRIIIKPLGAIFFAVVLGIAFFLAARSRTGTQEANSTPGSVARPSSGGSAGNLIVAANWKCYTENNGAGKLEQGDVSPAGKPLPGLRVTTERMGDKPWNVGLSLPLKTAFNNGEKVNLHFWARLDKPGQLGIVMQKNTPGFPDCFHEVVAIGPTWKEYHFTITTTPMATYESMLAFHTGYQMGTVELADVRLER